MTASCTLEAQEGMVIHAHSENVLRARRNLIELLLAEVPDSRGLAGPGRTAGGQTKSAIRSEMRTAFCAAGAWRPVPTVAGTGAKGSIGRGRHRHIGLPFYNDQFCQKCDECNDRCPLDIAPVSKRGKPGGVCGSELSKNDEIPEICEDCPLA